MAVIPLQLPQCRPAPQTLDINGLASGNGFLRVSGSASTGHILKITPPPGSGEIHIGATVDIAAIDDNGRGDILIAASLKRVGGELLAQVALPVPPLLSAQIPSAIS